jgi:hypothetical protein
MSASRRGTSVARWMATPHPNGQLGINVVQSASLLQRPASFNAASTVALRTSQSPAAADVAPLAPSGGVAVGAVGKGAGVVSGVGDATAAGLSTLGGTSRGAEHAASVSVRVTAALQRARRSGGSNGVSLLET